MRQYRGTPLREHGLTVRIVNAITAWVMAILVSTSLWSQQRDELRYTNMPELPGAAPTIDAPVSTGFGTYTPYRVPKHRGFAVQDKVRVDHNLSNVATRTGRLDASSLFNSSEIEQLRTDHVLVRTEPVGTFGQIYIQDDRRTDFLNFVTVDAALNGLRTTSEEAYRSAQRDFLRKDLAGGLEEIATEIGIAVASESHAPVKKAMLRALAYVETGRLLLDPSVSINPRASKIARTERQKLATGHPDRSEIFGGRTIDYGRIMSAANDLPDEQLGRYRSALAWLNSMHIRLDGSLDDVRMAAVLAQSVGTLDESHADRMATVADVEQFFAGDAQNRISPIELSELLRSWYGFQYGNGYSYLADDESIGRLIEFIQSYAAKTDGAAMRLQVLPAPSARSLDLFETLARSGNDAGDALLNALRESRQSDGRARALAQRLQRLPFEMWTGSHDLLSLYTASVVGAATEGDARVPAYMRTEAWEQKRKSTALASWTGSVTQSQTIEGGQTIDATGIVGSSGDGDRPVPAIVEPDPVAWSAVAAHARYLQSGLVDGKRGRLVSVAVAEKLNDIENASVHFMRIAAHQLDGRALQPSEKDLLESIGERIAAWETYTDPTLRLDGTPVVVSAAGSGTFSPAMGHPGVIYVLTPSPVNPDEIVVARGGVFTYLETTASSKQHVANLTRGSASSNAVDASSIVSVNAKLSTVTATSDGVASAGSSTRSQIRLELESNLVRSSSGGVWYTVHAPGYDGASIVTTVVDEAGRAHFQSRAVRIENGERYDLVPTDELESGHYFIRVNDITGRLLASARFMIVR